MYRYLHQETILIFSSSNQLLNAEDALADNGLSYRVIPNPKEIHNACGLALAFAAEDHHQCLAALQAAEVPPDAVYQRQGHEFTVLSCS